MIYITFERGDPKFLNTTARALAQTTAVQQRQLRKKWLLCSTRFFCVREFIKTESATDVQLAFLLRFNILCPTRKSICLWNHQFEQIGCQCKGKILCCMVAIQISTDAAARLCAMRSLQRWYLKIQDLLFQMLCRSITYHVQFRKYRSMKLSTFFESPCIIKFQNFQNLGKRGMDLKRVLYFCKTMMIESFLAPVDTVEFVGQSPTLLH